MSRTKLQRLTPEQQQALGPWRDRWSGFGLATGPADRGRAERGVRRAYRDAGLEPPEIVVWLRSPLEGAVGAVMVSQVRSQVREQVWAQVWAQVGSQVRSQVGSQVWAQVRAQVWAQVGSQVGSQVRDQVRSQVWAQVWAQIGSQIVAQVWEQVWTCCYGHHDAHWLAFHAYFSRHCAVEGPDRLTGHALVASAAGWWWPFEGAVILTERPVDLCRDDEGRLHSEDGPALLYPDGWGIWAWHGVRVPQRVIEEPDTLSVEEALSERNAEIRRVMLTRIGPEGLGDRLEVVDEVSEDVVEVAEGEDGLPVPVGLRGARLLRIPSRDGMPPMQWVSLVNSTPEPEGEVKRYHLRVPPDVGTAREAAAWTFDVAPEEYQPAIET